MNQRQERGDTLIEVLVAITILSLAVVIAQSVMNYGQSIAQQSVERTSTQGHLNSQFSYLRFARDQYKTDPASAGGLMWQKITGSFATGGSTDAETCNGTRPRSEARMFYINESAQTVTTPAAFAAAAASYPTGAGGPLAAPDVPEPGEGIWLLARSGGSGTTYIDFYAKACWSSLVGSQMERATSVMRLYAP